MSSDHYWLRDDNIWLPFAASGDVYGGGSASTLDSDYDPVRQPVGFRGAAPGASLDDRGLPRVRVPARMRRGTNQ